MAAVSCSRLARSCNIHGNGGISITIIDIHDFQSLSLSCWRLLLHCIVYWLGAGRGKEISKHVERISTAGGLTERTVVMIRCAVVVLAHLDLTSQPAHLLKAKLQACCLRTHCCMLEQQGRACGSIVCVHLAPIAVVQGRQQWLGMLMLAFSRCSATM